MLNQCAFFGRLTADPEIRQVGENAVVGEFTIAVERDIPGKDGERGVDFMSDVRKEFLFKSVALRKELILDRALKRCGRGSFW